MKTYKITIEETRTVTRKQGKDWVKVGEKEVERESRWASEENEPKTRVEPVYGYSPEIEKETTETREIYMQTVDDLDLENVVRAVNGLTS